MRTLVEILSEIKQHVPREAVRWSNGLRMWTATYARLYGAIGAVAALFDERRIGKGDRVLIWGENRLEWVAVFWACVARGIHAVPVDYRFSPDLVRRIQAESQPKLVIDNQFLDRLADLPPVTHLEPVE